MANIRALCNMGGDISFSFVYRVGNTVAHLAARINVSANSEKVYLANFLQGLIDLPEFDI